MQTQETVVKKRQTIFVIFVRNLYLIQKGVAHKPWVKFIQLLSKVFLQDFYWGRLTTRVEKQFETILICFASSGFNILARSPQNDNVHFLYIKGALLSGGWIYFPIMHEALS